MLRFLCALLLTLPLSAMTYEMVRDEHLAEDAQAIVIGRVISGDHEVAVERSIKGDLSGTIQLRLPGNPSLHIDGVPRFRTGDRVLLFLLANGEGTFSPLHLAMGAFREDGRYALRDLSADDGPRDFERFAKWLEHPQRAADYFVDERVAPNYSFIEYDNLKIRWFEFQQGSKITFHVDQHVDVTRRAMQVWNGERGSVVALDIAGPGAALTGLRYNDGRNSIIFGDPNNEIPGRYVCGRGGIMAMAGSWLIESERLPHRGAQFVPMLNADVIVNDGIECHDTPLPLEETLTHELGHTIGLGHSCGPDKTCFDPAENEAVMRAAIHLDGRGGQLSSDDIEALRMLYTREGPLVGFNYAIASRTARFTPTAALDGVEYEWDFGDGSARSAQFAPSHTYERAGRYTVRLFATDGTGTNEIVHTITIGAKRRAVR
jgi:PKD domain/Matrixin